MNEPICIQATLGRAISIPWYPIALDALLMSAVSIRDNLPPIEFSERNSIQIPLEMKEGLYLASLGLFEKETHEKKWLLKRFPIAEAQSMGDLTLKRVSLSAGLSKGYRLPMETTHLHNDTMTWFASGEAEEIRLLLSWIHYLGKKRSVGLGKVLQWNVTTCETWEGFPVIKDGCPLRPLPLDWPGLKNFRIERRVLTPPYWERHREQQVAV